MTDQDSTRMKHYERWHSALRMTVHGLVGYVILAYAPVPGWLAVEPSFFLLAFVVLISAGIGYVGMATWQWYSPTGQALTADELPD